MKKLIISLFLLSSVIAFCQKGYQGKVTYLYKEIVNVDEFAKEQKISLMQAKQLIEKNKQFLEKKFTLLFDRNTSTYKQNEALAGPSLSNKNYSPTSNNVLYKNILEKESLESNEYMGKRFLVYEDLKNPNWQLTNETRKIGDYTVYKATRMTKLRKNDAKYTEVTAWYSPQIPVSNGPSRYWGLPGLILQVNYDNYMIVCIEIAISNSKNSAIKRPKKGEKIKREDFEILRKKKFQEYMERNRRNKSRGD